MVLRATLSLGMLLVASLVVSSSYAGCGGVGLASASDRDLLYSSDGGQVWQTFNGFAQLDPMPSPRPISFLYVMRTTPNSPRAGVLVIKSGRLLSSGAPLTEQQKTVHLVRNEFAARFRNICSAYGDRTNKPFPLEGRRIPAKSYDDFHDFAGRQPPEIAVLRAFHVNYEGPAGQCRTTDDPHDGDRIVSNRSQFSFTRSRVRDGQITGLAEFFGRGIADAGMSEQRTEIRRYRIASDGVSCVSFQIPVSRPGNFIRINDLDAREGPLDLRIGEKEWN